MDNTLFRVKKEQVRMMQRRGYNIEREQAVLTMTLAEFNGVYTQFATQHEVSFRRALLNVYEKGEDRALVAFVDNTTKSKQLGVDPVRAFIALFQQFRCNQGVLISQQPLSKDASDELGKTTAKFVQHFLESEILTAAAAMGHFLSPGYEVVPDAEAVAFFRENRVRPMQLPTIHGHNPIAKYLGAGAGTLIRKNNDVIAGETLVDKYRSYSIVDKTKIFLSLGIEILLIDDIRSCN